MTLKTLEAIPCPRAATSGSPRPFASPAPAALTFGLSGAGKSAAGYTENRQAMAGADINVWPLGPPGRASG
jgi:hypothetical protein